VKDSLEAALAAESPGVENMKDGVDLTLKQLAAAFGKFNLVDIDPLGEKFDPHQHQAIQVVESDQPASTVVTVLQKGYRLNERTLRPALVMVAKGKDA
jgi:molecular chaperone GrpE